MYGYNASTMYAYNMYGPGGVDSGNRKKDDDPMELSPAVNKAGMQMGLRADMSFLDKEKEFCEKFDSASDSSDKARRYKSVETLAELVKHVRLELAEASGDPRKVKPAGELLHAGKKFASNVLGLSEGKHRLDQATMLYCNIVFLTHEFRVSQVRTQNT